jgi:hypothetical protein
MEGNGWHVEGEIVEYVKFLQRRASLDIKVNVWSLEV